MKSKKPVLFIGIFIVLLGVIYLGFSVYFGSHFFLNSTVNGIAAGGKSADDIFAEIEKEAKEYTISFIDEKGEVVDILTGDQIGFSVVYDEDDIAELVEAQNGFHWLNAIFEQTVYETAKGNTCDKAKLANAASGVKLASAPNAKVSEDAYIRYDSAQKQFVIVEEVIGTEITPDSIQMAVLKAVENFDEEIKISDGDCYARPALMHDSEELLQALAKANGYMNTTITYDLGVTTEVVDPDVKASWFDVQGTEVSFVDDAIGLFVDEMGKKYNTFGRNKNFVSTSGDEVTVPAGSLGWKIAYNGEITQIKEDLEAGEDVTRDFVYLYKGASHGENDYGDSYVEVNLTEQHVYVYKDGEMVFDTDCVTGNVFKGTDTHTGAYPIAYKAKNATLRGANYTSFVNYWMPFNNGEGLHDATWRSSFGGTIYQGGGSHGCVNLPLSAAKEIYEIVDEGWPVLVFFTGDTEAEIEAVRGPYMQVMSLIASFESVTLETAPAIAEARAAYDALTEEQKAKVANYDTLVAAEQTLWYLQTGIPQF